MNNYKSHLLKFLKINNQKKFKNKFVLNYKQFKPINSQKIKILFIVFKFKIFNNNLVLFIKCQLIVYMKIKINFNHKKKIILINK
jgi:hypothetical protein